MLDEDLAARLKLKRPCKNCPFSVVSTRIIFACRERAEEIEELAYRQGFPCHKSAVEVDEEVDGDVETFFDFGEGSQFCVGYLLVHYNDGNSELPPSLDNEEFPEDWEERVRPYLGEAFGSVEEFLAADEGGRK